MDINEFIRKYSSKTYKYKVTPDIYYSFQRCSNDFNPLHTDISFAKERGFNDCVMYGNILNAFVSNFIGMQLPTRNVMIQSQDIMYHKPVYLNDELIFTAEIDYISESVNIIKFKFKFEKEANEKKILVAKGHVQIGLLI